jgi:hypothetical protein
MSRTAKVLATLVDRRQYLQRIIENWTMPADHRLGRNRQELNALDWAIRLVEFEQQHRMRLIADGKWNGKADDAYLMTVVDAMPEGMQPA